MIAIMSGRACTDVDPTKPHQMTLTREEQDILDGNGRLVKFVCSMVEG